MKILKKTLLALSEPLALVPEPYSAVAERLGVTEQELFTRIRGYTKAGIIRRMGIVLSHVKVGYRCNALVVWKVEKARLEKTGKVFAGFPQVSHCYARRSYPLWPFNLYTMVHSRTRKELLAVIRSMVNKAGGAPHKVLYTVKELKKIKNDPREILK